MPKLVPTAAGALLLAGLAFALNPSGEQHRARIKAAVAERSPIAGALGLGAAAALVTTYHDLGVASYTTIDDRVLSLGAFGVVYVRPIGRQR
jgi:hypothetical protein